MSASGVATYGSRSYTPGEQRRELLGRLASAIRERGGVALLALAEGDYPVLYVRRGGGTVPVVVMRGITGDGWWFIWGRTSQVESGQVEAAAAHLAAQSRPPGGPAPAASGGSVPRPGNLVAEGRANLKAVS